MLEEMLSGVVASEIEERVTIATSSGLRPPRQKRRRVREVSQAAPEPVAVHEDSVADFDRNAVELFVHRHEGGRVRKVEVRQGEHARSPYVVSLQGMVLANSLEEEVERVPVGSSMSRAHEWEGSSMPVDVYATMTSDLTGDFSSPHFLEDQFTPGSFEESYRTIYGRFDSVRSFFTEASSIVTGMFQRVERVEQEVVREVEESVGVFEVPRFSYARALAGFVGLALMVTVPAQAVSLYRSASVQKDDIAVAGNAAVAELLAVKDSGSVPDSAEALKNASSKFREADALVNHAGALAVGVASVLPKQYRSARALLEVGDKSSNAANLLAQGFDKVFADPDRRLDERLDTLAAYSRSALVLLTDASRAARSVDVDSLPEDQRLKVRGLLAELDKSTQAVQECVALADLMSGMAGKDGLRKYLLVFQNPTELRPTGGFMGSLAEVTMAHGEIRDIHVPGGGTYDLKGQLTARVASPKPLQLINPVWQLQDANWFPDFPTSAEKIRWFWSKSGQPTLDGVVAINATFVEKLLAITGPIDMPEYGKVIDASNFLLETQKSVEVEYDKTENKPKKFIGDLADKLKERVGTFGKEDWLKVAALVSESLENKDIQVAFTKDEEEAAAERYGWNGRMKDAPGDSLAIIETNVAGQKTDGVISEEVQHDVHIAANGSIEDEVTLTRTHNGKKGELFRGVRNVSYLRVYVPKGSEFVSGSGFQTPDASLFKKVESDQTFDAQLEAAESRSQNVGEDIVAMEEGNRTTFGGWLQLDPGQTQVVKIRYRLPFTASEVLSKLEEGGESAKSARAAYLLLLTSQSGKTSRHIRTTVQYPPAWNVAWTNGAVTTESPSSFSVESTWDRDRVVAALLTPPNAQTQNR